MANWVTAVIKLVIFNLTKTQKLKSTNMNEFTYNSTE